MASSQLRGRSRQFGCQPLPSRSCGDNFSPFGDLPATVIQRVSEAGIDELGPWTERPLDVRSLEYALNGTSMQRKKMRRADANQIRHAHLRITSAAQKHNHTLRSLSNFLTHQREPRSPANPPSEFETCPFRPPVEGLNSLRKTTTKSRRLVRKVSPSLRQCPET